MKTLNVKKILGHDTFSFQAPAGLPGYDAAVVGTSTITDFTRGSDQIGISSPFGFSHAPQNH
jgi:hypothetical protein